VAAGHDCTGGGARLGRGLERVESYYCDEKSARNEGSSPRLASPRSVSVGTIVIAATGALLEVVRGVSKKLPAPPDSIVGGSAFFCLRWANQPRVFDLVVVVSSKAE
jgi:hypothetical protein